MLNNIIRLLFFFLGDIYNRLLYLSDTCIKGGHLYLFGFFCLLFFFQIENDLALLK